MTTTQRTVAVVLATACVALVCSAVFFRSWPMRGWLGMACYAVIGLAFVSGTFALPRRLGAALGAYFFTVAADFGLPRVWQGRPVWIDPVITVLLVSLTIWLLVEWWLRRSPSASAA